MTGESPFALERSSPEDCLFGALFDGNAWWIWAQRSALWAHQILLSGPIICAGSARIGGTKGVNLAAIMDLRPDLVLANLEENDAQDVMALEIAGIPCWVCDVRSVERAFACSLIWATWWGVGKQGETWPRSARSSGHRDGRIFSSLSKR